MIAKDITVCIEQRVVRLLLLISLGLAIHADTTSAAERPWILYENAYIQAYSNESEKAVRKLLSELEDFRAAVTQVANIRIPQGAPKAQVVVFASRNSFQELVGSDYIDGFATVFGGLPYMVLPHAGSNKRTASIIRHEYAHVLLAYKRFPYPKWFQEGFAELMSATTFRKRRRQFSVGDFPGRNRAGAFLLPWSEIVSAGFDTHSIEDPVQASDAYLQCWLLTHYFMLGNNFQNSQMLVEYLTRLANGEDSLVAFESVVGMPAEEFGARLFREYGARNMKYVVYDFRPEFRDHDFTSREMNDAEAEALLSGLSNMRFPASGND